MNAILHKLVSDSVLDEQAAQAVDAMTAGGESLDEALIAASGLGEEKVLRLLAEEFGVPWADLDANPPEKAFLAKFPARILLTHRLLPLKQDNGSVTVAFSRLFDTTGLDELRLACGLEVQLVLAPSAEITRCINSLLGVGADTLQSLVSEAEADGDAAQMGLESAFDR